MRLPNGQHNIPPRISSAHLQQRALAAVRSGTPIPAVARGWSGSGVRVSTVANYLIDGMHTTEYTVEDVESIMRACGVDDMDTLRPIIEDIVRERDCSMRNVKERVQEASGFGAGRDVADVYNLIRLCVVDTCRAQVILRSL